MPPPLSAHEAVSQQIDIMAIIVAISAVGQWWNNRHGAQRGWSALCQSADWTRVALDCGAVLVASLRLAATVVLYVRDRLYPRRHPSRTTIAADRAASARIWRDNKDDLDKVYLIAPSP
jgi:hypothetical protein